METKWPSYPQRKQRGGRRSICRGEGGRTEDLHCIPGRGGEREREREEAVERLRWLEREQRPGHWQEVLRLYGQRFARWLP